MLGWQDFPGAPPLGKVICAVSDIPRGSVLAVLLGEYPVLILMVGPHIKVFVNACPHQFLPLNQRSNNILSSDGQRLVCSNHLAEFGSSDGQGRTGFGIGSCLATVPSRQKEGLLIVGDAET